MGQEENGVPAGPQLERAGLPPRGRCRVRASPAVSMSYLCMAAPARRDLLLHERARAKGKSGAYPGNSSAAKESPVQAARLAEECTKMMQTRRGHSWERLTLSPLLVPPK